MTVAEDKYLLLKVVGTRDAMKLGSIDAMNTRSCVISVGEEAQVTWLKILYNTTLLTRPTSYLGTIAAANKGFPMFTVAG